MTNTAPRPKRRRNLHPKVAAIGTGTAISTIIMGLAKRAHVALTPDEAIAISAVICGIVAWYSPERPLQDVIDHAS